MKITVNEEKGKNLVEYPCLMVSKDGDIVILFVSEGRGLVINALGDCEWGIGAYYDDWTMSRFEPFNGSITLSND